MKSKKKDSPETFFFGLKSNRFPPSANHPQTFLFDRELSTGFEPKDIPLSAMLEIFCYAVHGRVLGYKTYSSKIVPIFDKKLSDKNALKTVEISRKACTQLAINWPNDKASHSITKEDARKVIKRIKPIFRSASKIAKNRWMNFPFDFDSDGSDVSTIAKRFTQQSKSKITLQSGKNKKHFFNHLGLKRKDKVIIFGAGEAGFEVYNRIHKKVSVIAFCDNNRKKIGITDKGIPVVYSKTIPSLSFTFIIVASVYAFEIHSQLIKEINVDFSKILISPIF